MSGAQIWLCSTPKNYLTDVTIKTDLDTQHRDATISADVQLGGPAEAFGGAAGAMQ